MVYVALAEAALIAAVLVVLGGLLRSLVRQHARERDLLLNQLLHAAGKTWTPPPAEVFAPPVEPEVRMWTPSPEQLVA